MCLSGAHYSIDDIEDRIIEMAWEDRTPFEAIEYQFGMKENDVRKLMRENLTRKSFELWRKRVKGRKTKHRATSGSIRFKSNDRKSILGGPGPPHGAHGLWGPWALGPMGLGAHGPWGPGALVPQGPRARGQTCTCKPALGTSRLTVWET